jgi:tyrosine-protein phosphatase YwqE
MSKNRDNTKKYAQLHGIVSEMHQLENRFYEMLEAWDFKNSNEYWRLADQFHDLNTQFSKSVWKEHQDR